jgi:hypothetical protein
VWSHTASTVTPSEYDPDTQLWKTSSGRIVVYTDGSSLGNGQEGAAAGLGVWWAEESSRSVLESWQWTGPRSDPSLSPDQT